MNITLYVALLVRLALVMQGYKYMCEECGPRPPHRGIVLHHIVNQALCSKYL